MNMARGIRDALDREPDLSEAEAGPERPPEIGSDERRMHVRAYNHWVSLLRHRAYPSIEDLDPENIADFGPNSVLLDFTRGIEDPVIRYLGAALREECGVNASIVRVAEVPNRSLLSRLTDHYLQIIANRAPIGFEAEFVGQRGHNTLYRGILMPFSSDEERIDFIYGVINWKEMLDAESEARLHAEIEQSRRQAPELANTAPIWADGPSRGLTAAPAPAAATPFVCDDETGLADRLMLARESAAAARASDTRSRAALYRALARAYDFAVAADEAPEAYAELLDDAGLTAQARAPMTPAVKLVFGADYDKTRLTEFAAVLSHARRLAVPQGGLDAFLEVAPGGIKGIVQAERACRRPAPVAASPADRIARAAAELRARPPLARVALASPGEGDFTVLLARRSGDTLEVVADLGADAALTERAIRRAAA
jgi:hypothetical protein